MKRLQRLYRRKVSESEIVSPELARAVASLSSEIQRQLAVIITRKGDVAFVVVGDRTRIWIPDLGRVRLGPGRLKGLRCVHTHLNGEPMSREDLTDLVLMGLDLMVAIQVAEGGVPGALSVAHILPKRVAGEDWQLTNYPDTGRMRVDFQSLIRSVEDELSRAGRGRRSLDGEERAVLASVYQGSLGSVHESLDELRELARSSYVTVCDTVIQQVKRPNPRFLMGRGKLSELVLSCLRTDANLLIFDNELTPARSKALRTLLTSGSLTAVN